MMFNYLLQKGRFAFTLAEILITLTIIGVVATFTIPNLISNIGSKQYQVAAKKINATIIEALTRMKTDDNLVGYETTEQFIAEFKKYMKIAKTCPNSDLNGCYPTEFKVNNKVFELAKVKSAKSLGHEWNTQIEGFVLSNGVSFIAAYNPECTNDDYKGCVALAYDLNGTNKTNKFTGMNGESDLATYNATFGEENDRCGNITYRPGKGYYLMLDGPEGDTPECIEQNLGKMRNWCDQRGGSLDQLHGEYYCLQ